MKKLISLCLAVLMTTLIFAGCKNKGQVEKEIPSDISDFPMANNIDGNYVATDYKYNFYKDVLKLSDAPEIKLEPSPIIPNNINGSSVEYYKYINKTEAFVALEKEVGSYNLKTQNYNKFFSIPDKASAIIIAYNTDHIVYDLNYHNDKLAGQLTDVDNRELWIY